MNENFENDLIEAIKDTYSSLDNFASAIYSYQAYYSDEDFTIDMRKYTSSGVEPIIVESAVYYNGMIDVNVFHDGKYKHFIVNQKCSNDIMRKHKPHFKESRTVDGGGIPLTFLEGQLFLVSVTRGIITYLELLDINDFEEDLRTMVEAEAEEDILETVDIFEVYGVA